MAKRKVEVQRTVYYAHGDYSGKSSLKVHIAILKIAERLPEGVQQLTLLLLKLAGNEKIIIGINSDHFKRKKLFDVIFGFWSRADMQYVVTHNSRTADLRTGAAFTTSVVLQ
ncbi:8468_t:CDS:2 [Paraglomus occultum]|uniref:8468_t:CDS:1 n=1 Tax=Paraglomus occultum TaxID=144539 RepID=A0A9N9GJ35_9GLOM|nr:8468_t:CDS:2 [Paraglomus occultum]